MRRSNLSRVAMFVPGVLAAAAGWQYLNEPMGGEGLVSLALAGLITWPLAVIGAVFGIPAGLKGMWPRSWRRRWRHRPEWMLNYGRKYAKSARMPDWFRKIVLFADRYRCSACGWQVLGRTAHVDHFLPWSLGGCTTLLNCFTLCETCNLAKGNAWIFRGKFWAGSGGPMAKNVLLAERRHRYNLIRWLRAAWAIGA